MKTYEVKIKVTTENPEDCLVLGNLVQHTVSNVAHKDLIKLLSKVKDNPKLVSKALSFI